MATEYRGSLYVIKHRRYDQEDDEYAVIRAHNRMEALRKFALTDYGGNCHAIAAFWGGSDVITEAASSEKGAGA